MITIKEYSCNFDGVTTWMLVQKAWHSKFEMPAYEIGNMPPWAFFHKEERWP